MKNPAALFRHCAAGSRCATRGPTATCGAAFQTTNLTPYEQIGKR
jgi:hypothetical protein